MTTETPRERGHSEGIAPEASGKTTAQPNWDESQLKRLLRALSSDSASTKELNGQHTNLLKAIFNTDAAEEALLSDNAILVDLAKRNSQLLLERILQANLPDAAKINQLSTRFSKLGSFFSQLKSASQFLTYPDEAKDKIKTAAFKLLHGSDDIMNLFRTIFEVDGTVTITGHTIKILDWRGFWIAFNEIFFSEDYYFSTDENEPLIIDGGANIGLATCYFKWLYPNARILSFEPSEQIHAILQHNVAQLSPHQISVLGYALSNEEGVLDFSTPRSDSLAGSLFGERLSADSAIEQVQARRLRHWLERERSIQFIKLDIEGAELDVLKDVEDQLHKVENMFIEYHGSAHGPQGDLVEILDLLSRNHFRFHITKSMGTEKYTGRRPLTHLSGRFSQTIYAKNIKEDS